MNLILTMIDFTCPCGIKRLMIDAEHPQVSAPVCTEAQNCLCCSFVTLSDASSMLGNLIAMNENGGQHNDLWTS